MSVAKVWKQLFWMKLYGAKTAKRSVLWSNSKNVGIFKTGVLRRKGSGVRRTAPALVKHYVDSSGKKRFSGILKNLKRSGTLSLMV